MSRFNSKFKKKPEEFQVAQLRFLGEQDGPPERELKCRLSEFFERDENINTAYLARVAYGGESFAVALCLRARSGPEPALAENVGKIFAFTFGSHENLDIILLTETQEAEMLRVCEPFFERGQI